MLILNLNLLSPTKKKSNEYIVHFLFLKGILEISIFIITILAIALILSWKVLQEDFDYLSASAILVNKGSSTYNQEIRKINKINRNLVISGKNFQTILPRFLEIANLLPASVKLTTLQLNLLDNKLLISGTALTRDDLLSLQDNLKQITLIKTFTIPPAQLFEKKNVNFELHIELKNSP